MVWFLGYRKKYEGKIFQLEDYIDTSCPSDVKRKIISYLSETPVILAGQQPTSKCGLCGELVEVPSFKSDGIWLWPKSLSHYVEKHSFCIPNAMAEHILLLDGIPPQDFDVDVKDLPWP